MTARKRSKGRPKRDRRHASRSALASAIDISIRATVLDHLRDLSSYQLPDARLQHSIPIPVAEDDVYAGRHSRHVRPDNQIGRARL